jgi:hypothetical protein
MMKNNGKRFAAILGTVWLLTGSALGQEWSIKADYTESCCCAITCPCVFGSPSTRDYCDWNGLIEIKKGRYGDVNLDGITVVTTARMGEWIKYSVSQNTSEEQMKAAVKLVEAAWDTSPKVKVLGVRKVPISVKRTDSRIKFSTPTSQVEIEIVKGHDGKPTKILNLPKAQHQNMTQYKAIVNKFKDAKRGFDYSGTNGFTSKLDSRGKK